MLDQIVRTVGIIVIAEKLGVLLVPIISLLIILLVVSIAWFFIFLNQIKIKIDRFMARPIMRLIITGIYYIYIGFIGLGVISCIMLFREKPMVATFGLIYAGAMLYVGISAERKKQLSKKQNKLQSSSS